MRDRSSELPWTPKDDELQAAKMPSAKCTCEQTGYLPFFEPVVKSFWPTLRTGLSDYVEQVRQARRRLDLPLCCHSPLAHDTRPAPWLVQALTRARSTTPRAQAKQKWRN